MEEQRNERIERCAFCEISEEYVSGSKAVLWSDANVFIVKDINPHADHHLLVIPHKHIASSDPLYRSHKKLCRFFF